MSLFYNIQSYKYFSTIVTFYIAVHQSTCIQSIIIIYPRFVLITLYKNYGSSENLSLQDIPHDLVYKVQVRNHLLSACAYSKRQQETMQPLGQWSIYNTIIADQGSPYVATFQCTLFTTRFSTNHISALLYFHDSKQRRGDRAALLLSPSFCFITRRHP